MNQDAKTKPRYWLGPGPAGCDLCQAPITDEFVDGRVQVLGRSTWANTCPSCHLHYGLGIGTGAGQRYVKKEDRWLKVEG